jgi:AraC-like DNA-binding protein
MAANHLGTGDVEQAESAGVRNVMLDARRHAMLRRIYGYIEDRLGDPDLTPRTIAAAHHISTRYLHKMFESEGCTVAAWVRHSRLEHCSRDLVDPAKWDRPVSAIAARWGFTDGAHFGRVFRAAYGIPPGKFRRRHIGLHTARSMAGPSWGTRWARSA